ncbi:MAG: hypothetical protein HYX27_06095 [Acidobacteria bacterium]|nr:hypothetical protein [Acidobacteriota bacterium]
MTSISAILVVSDATLAAGTKRVLSELPIRILVDEPSVADWNEFCERVEAMGPDVVILDLGILRDSIEETMERIRKVPRPPSVIVVHTEAHAETILRVIRAGAMEYCNPPVEKPMRTALEKILRQKMESAPAKGSGKTFGFLGAKGGCGATTIACHTAVSLPSLIDDRVLLADFDLQGGMVEFLLKCKANYSVMQAMQNAHRLDESYWKALVTNGIVKLDVLTAPPASAQRQAMPVDRLPGVLQFARTVYGATVVDLGRFLTMGALSAMSELDQTLIVTTLDVLALHHARKIVESLLDAGYARERIGLVVNRVTSQRDLEPEDVEKLLGVPITAVLGDDSTSLHEAYPEGKLLMSDSRLYQQIVRMARKLAGVPETQQKKKFLFFGS